jgi:hypothetical protein
MADDRQELKRVEVGFSGGQAIVMRISDRAYADLRKAAQSRNGWYEVESADGVVALDLGQVVFVNVVTGEHRVGFAGP